MSINETRGLYSQVISKIACNNYLLTFVNKYQKQIFMTN